MPTAESTARRMLAALLAATAALLAACGDDDEPVQRNATGALTQPAEMLLIDLHLGDCVANLRSAYDNDEGAHNGVPTVRAVPCSYLHDGEVLQIKRITETSYPGTQIVDGEASLGRLELEQRLDQARIKSEDLRRRREFQLLTMRPDDNRWDFEKQRDIFYLALFAKPRRGPLDTGLLGRAP
jgi:hypothetical protein